MQELDAGNTYDELVGGTGNYEARRAVAKEFLSTHRDAYDFIVVLPTFATDLGDDVGGLHWTVRNDVEGIGKLQTDLGASFGSDSRLQSVIDVAALVPGSPFYRGVDDTLAVVAHETSHRWSGAASFLDPATGQSDNSLLGKDGSHWSYFLDSDASLLYGSDWVDNADGTFTATESQRRYSSLDLYLMGFLSPLEVGQLTLLEPDPSVSALPTDPPPPDGTTIPAVARSIGVDDIIAAEGLRVPDASSAQQTFRTAFVVLARPGAPPTTVDLEFVDEVRRQWANTFFFMTRGRGVMETDLVEVPSGPVASSPSIVAGLDYLFSVQAPAGAWSDGEGVDSRATSIAMSAVAAFPNDSRSAASLTTGASFLQTVGNDSVESISHRALGLVAAGVEAGDPVAALHFLRDPALNADGGYGYGLGYASTVIDSVLAAETNKTFAATSGLESVDGFLLGSQNDDGGWPFVPGGVSQAVPTARVLRYLSTRPRTDAMATSAGLGIAFLNGLRDADGFYGEGRTDPAATAVVLLALSEWAAASASQVEVSVDGLLAEQRTDGSWEGSAYQTAEVLLALRTLLTPNLALEADDFALAANLVSEGEPVEASVLVRNPGFASATGITVGAFDSNGVPFGTTVAAPDLGPGESTRVILVLDTAGHLGSTQVFVVVDPDGLIDELREDDNRVAGTLLIQPPPAGADLIVAPGSLVVAPDQIERVPQSLVVTVAIGNLGLTPVTGAVVELIANGFTAATATVDVGPQASQVVTLSATVSATGESVPIEVRIDPADLIPEANEGNNTAGIMVPVVPAVDLSVRSLALVPNPVGQGQDLVVSFTVQNLGTAPVSGASAAVTVKGADSTVVAVLPVADVILPPGGSVQRQAIWRANTAGALSVVASAAAPGDVDPSNDLATADLVVDPSPLANLAIPVDGLTIDPEPPLEAAPANVSVRIANGGGVASGSFVVELLAGDTEATAVSIGTHSVADLAPGGEMTLTSALTPGPNATTIVARLDTAGQVTEFDEDDNAAVLVVQPRTIPNLVLSDADVLVDEPFPRSDQTVQVTLSVLNDGGQQAASSVVELFQGDPELGGVLLGSATLPAIDSQQRAEASFTWSTAGLTGEQLLVGVVDGAEAVTEGRENDNRGQRSVTVQDADLALSNPYFSPNGDGSKDRAEVFYRLAQAAPVRVDVTDAEANLVRTVQASAQVGGSVAWDGRDAAGRVVNDGPYDLAVYSEGGGSGTLLGNLVAVVDTNRSPLRDVAGTPLAAVENLAPDPELERPCCSTVAQMAPGDAGIVYFSRSQIAYNNYDCGFHLKPVGGGDSVRLTDPSLTCEVFFQGCSGCEPYTIALSEDGTKIAHTGHGPQIVDLNTQAIWNPFIGPETLEPDLPPIFSPDGQYLYYATSSRELARVAVAGGPEELLAVSARYIDEFSFSPDGSRIAFVSNRELFRVPATGGTPIKVLPAGSLGRSSSNGNQQHHWLPGGQEIAFTSEDYGVRAVDVDTFAVRDLFVSVSDAKWQFDGNTSLSVDPRGDGVAFSFSPTINTYPYYSQDVWEVPTSGGAGQGLWSPPGVQDLIDVTWSPLGSFLYAEAKAPGNTYEYRALTSLANLGLQVTAARPLGAAALDFRGSAADLHFADYSLAVRSLGTSDPFVVIARSNAQVVKDLLASWVPSAPGLYEVELRARDVAGNLRTRRIKVAWSATSAIANLQRSPEFISPNGDGVQDLTLLTYEVVEPITTELAISDSTNQTVRRIPKTHLTTGSGAAIWDGRDDAGAVVQDGRYVVRSEGASVAIIVDDTPPNVDLVLLSGGAEMLPGFVNAVQLNASGQVAEDSAGQAIVTTVPVYRLQQSWQASDENLIDWQLQWGTQGQATATTVRTGVDQGEQTFTQGITWKDAFGRESLQAENGAPLSQVRGRFIRLQAVDKAGNSAETPALVPTEALFVTAIGDPEQLDPARGSLLLDGNRIPRLDLLRPLWKPKQTSAPDLTFEPKRMVFALDTSVALPLVSFEVAYREKDSAGAFLSDPPTVTRLSEYLIEWDARSVPVAAYDLEIRATDTSGRVFVAPLLQMGRNESLQVTTCVVPGVGERIATDWTHIVGSAAFQTGPSTGFRQATFRGEGGEYVLPLRPGSTSGPPWLADTGHLPGCLYTVEFSTKVLHYPDGISLDVFPLPPGVSLGDVIPTDEIRYKTLSAQTDVDLCTVTSTGSVEGSDLTTQITESFRKPVLSVEVLTQTQGAGGWTPRGGTGSFDFETIHQGSIGAVEACTRQETRLIAHLSDGGIFDTAQTTGMACHGPLPALVSCTTVAIGPVTRDGPAPYCTPHTPIYTVGLEAYSGTGAIQTLTAGVTALGGPATSPILVAPFTPAQTVNTTATFTAVGAEGLYSPFAAATDDQGDIGSAQGVASEHQGLSVPIIVDTTPPQVTVSSPSTGERVCPSTRATATGGTERFITVAGAISDANLEAFTVLLRDPSGGLSALNTESFEPTSLSLGGTLVEASVESLTTGNYEIVIDARDASGGSYCPPAVPFRLEMGSDLSVLRVAPSLFSPNGDGAFDSLGVEFVLDFDARVEVNVTNDATGAVHQILAVDAVAGPTALAWDGRDLSAALVPDGRYTLTATASDPCGNSDSESTVIELDRTAPVARIDTPPASATVGSVLEVLGEATDANLERYELAVAAAGTPTAFTTLATGTASTTGALATLDTSSLTPGPYLLLLLVVDAVQNSASTEVAIEVAPTSVIDSFAVSPALASPNGDGNRDTVSASFALLGTADVLLEVLSGTTVVATPIPLQSRSAGPHSLPLDVGALIDGDYAVRLRATDSVSGATEQEQVSLTLDRVGPVVDVLAPLTGGYTSSTVPVSGSVSDPHLVSWWIEHTAASGSPVEVVREVGETSGTLAVLDGLAAGSHRLEVFAEDGAENATSVTIDFTVDPESPAVAILQPTAGLYITGLPGPVPVAGSLSETNPAALLLEVSGANDGGSFRTLFSGADLPAGGELVSWNVVTEADGPAHLRLTATDAAGNIDTAEVDVTLDSTAPVARIDGPNFFTVPGPVSGEASDANFDQYELAIASGTSGTATNYVTIASSVTPVTAGTLATLSALPADGVHTLRLRTLDHAGNLSEEIAEITVDTSAPGAPSGLVAAVVQPNDVELQWDPAPEGDVTGYLVLRGAPGEPLLEITASPVPAPAYADLDRADGTWRYAVVAVDAAGHASEPSAEVSVEVDATPPEVALSAPTSGALVRGEIDVLGTATSHDFREYRLLLDGARIASSSVPVRGGTLASIDTGPMQEGVKHDLRLEAEDLAGNLAFVESSFSVDNTAPAAPTLVSATAAGADVALVWSASPATDLAGYLLYRDGGVVGLPAGGSVSDLSRYFLAATATSHSDLEVPDGQLEYQLQAVDLAGNFGPLSNTISVTIERRSPAATIGQPAHLERIDGVVTVLADVVDRDVTQVELQVREGGAATYTTLAVRSRFPWQADLDPGLFTSPVLELRAIATDLSGNVDPEPVPIVVFLDPALAPPVVDLQVDGQDAITTWTHPDPPRVAGSLLYDNGSSKNVNQPRPVGTMSASSTSSGNPNSGYDNSTYSTWRAATGYPQSWEVVFGQPAMLDGTRIYTAEGTTLDIQLRMDGTWVTVVDDVVAPSNGRVDSTLTSPLQAEGIRLVFEDSPLASAELREAYPTLTRLAPPQPYSDRIYALGERTREVVALSRFGGQATGADSARIYRPEITVASSNVGVPAVLVEGDGPLEGETVEIFSNSALVTTGTAGPAGTFALETPLVAGSNTLFAVGVAPNGDRSLPSYTWNVTYDPPPTAQLALVLTGITGSDVELEFTVAGDTTAITSLELERQASDGSSQVVSLGPTETTYVDSGVANGTYDYVVRALNFRGYAGPDSNSVTATVAAALLAVPSGLVVVAPAAGGELDLSWFAVVGADQYRIERGLDLAGPFGEVDTSATPDYADEDVIDGTTYFYRVRAVDVLGNASDPSVVVSGTSVDTVAPAAPTFDTPTTAGTPVVIASRTQSVGGMLEEIVPTVEVRKNGRLVGNATVSAGQLVETDLPTSLEPARRLDLSPDGQFHVYDYWGSLNRGVAIEAVDGSYLRTIEDANAYLETFRAISPDGQHAIVETQNDATNNDEIWLVDVATATWQSLGDPAVGQRTEPAWSPDSTRVAYVLSSSGNGKIGVFDISSGVEEVIDLGVYSTPDRPTWVSDSTLVTTQYDYPWTRLLLVDVDSGATTVLFEAYSFREDKGVSPDGDRIAWVSDSPNSWDWDVYMVQLSTGTVSQLTADANREESPVFSPDGRQMAWTSRRDLAFHDLTTGTTETHANAVGYNGSQLHWLQDGRLHGFDLTSRVSQFYSVPVRFDLADAPLDVGQNYFTAHAVDAAGNRSGPAAAIQITRPANARPDMAVSATLDPQLPLIGDPATAWITVENLGDADAVDVGLAVSIVSPDGGLWSEPIVTLPGVFGAGSSRTVPIVLDLTSLVGPQTLRAQVDPALAVDDADRSNDVVELPFEVLLSSDPTVGVALDLASLTHDGLATATVSVRNPGPTRDLDLNVELLDATGALVGTLGPIEVLTPIARGEERVFTRTISAAGLLAGDYEVLALLTDLSGPVAEGAAPLTIEADRTVSLTLHATAASFRSGEVVGLESRIANDSANAMLVGAGWELTVLDAGGGVLHASSDPVPSLALGGASSHLAFVPALPVGTHQAQARVLLGTQVLATATTQIVIEAAPRLVGAVSLSGPVAGEVRQGGAVTIDASVANQGGGASAPFTFDVLVAELSTSTQVFLAPVPGVSLLPGGSLARNHVLDTAGLAHGSYVVAARADGQALATATFEVVDGIGPTIEVLNLADGLFVQGSVTPRVRALDSGAVASVQVSVDGAAPVPLQLATGTALDGEWVATLPLPGDGPHTLVFGAADATGNDAAPVTVSIVSDATAPVVQVVGVADGAVLGTSVTAQVTATDANLDSIRALLDGAPAEPAAIAVTASGAHEIFGRAVDRAGNQAQTSVTFTVDLDAPVIDITGIADGETVARDVLPVVTATDLTPVQLTVTLDGGPWSAGTAVTSEGTHTLIAVAVDAVSHTATRTIIFTIDKSAPVITLTGVAPEQCGGGPVTPVFTVTDATQTTVTAFLDGASYQSGTPVTAEGVHELVVIAVDAAGLRSTERVVFVIDTTAPVIVVSGVTHGLVTASDVQPSWTVDEANLVDVTATLDLESAASGMFVSEEGAHTLIIEAADCAGLTGQTTITFAIDRTAPVITVDGLADGQCSTGPVTPVFTAADTHLDTTSATLDGAPFISGTPVTAEGTHTLAVTSVDQAGNQTTETRTFVVDDTAPVITVAGVTDGLVSAADVQPTWTVDDANPVDVTATLGVDPATSGMLVSQEGDYTLTIEATDCAGQISQTVVTFAIDRTAPVVTIGGLTDGQCSVGPVTPTFATADTHPDTTTATLNSTPFSSGTPVVAEGTHTLVVTAVDQADNRTIEIRTFVVDATAPVITIAGVTDGLVTAADVQITWGIAEPNLVSMSATLDQQSIWSGTVVTTEGEHILVIEATDCAGHTSQSTITFAIDRTPPVITIGGLTDGQCTTSPVAPTFAAADLHPGTTTGALDGQPFSSGTPVTTEGSHTLVITSVDQAGNVATEVRTFVVDDTAPAVTLQGVSDGAYYAGPVYPTWSATDANGATPTATLDGATLLPGLAVTAEGGHVLTVEATDCAGNTTSVGASFVIDLTDPLITVTGVVDGQVGSAPVTPIVTFFDINLDPTTTSLTLDGSPFASGNTVSVPGFYVLQADASDLAGRTASVTIGFQIVTVSGDGDVESEETDGDILVLIDCEHCVLCDTPPNLATALDQFGKGYLTVSDPLSFRDALRSGVYDTVVLYDSRAKTRKLHEELIEFVALGAGLVLVDQSPDRTLREPFGPHAMGSIRHASIGAGRAVWMRFDPESGRSGYFVSTLVDALTTVRPPAPLEALPRDAAMLQHVTTSPSGGFFDLTQTYPPPTSVVLAPAATATTPNIEWPIYVPATGFETRRAAMRLPAAPEVLTFEAVLAHGGTVVDTDLVEVEVTASIEDLTDEAVAAIHAVATGARGHRIRHAARDVRRASDRRVRGRRDAEWVIDELLHIAEDLADEGADDARYAVDRLIRAWALYWTELPDQAPRGQSSHDDDEDDDDDDEGEDDGDDDDDDEDGRSDFCALPGDGADGHADDGGDDDDGRDDRKPKPDKPEKPEKPDRSEDDDDDDESGDDD